MQGELKRESAQYGTAVKELYEKMHTWSPLYHGTRDYMLTFACKLCTLKKQLLSFSLCISIIILFLAVTALTVFQCLILIPFLHGEYEGFCGLVFQSTQNQCLCRRGAQAAVLCGEEWWCSLQAHLTRVQSQLQARSSKGVFALASCTCVLDLPVEQSRYHCSIFCEDLPLAKWQHKDVLFWQVMHTTLRVLALMLQQRRQLPELILPLDYTMRFNHSSITYSSDHVTKRVEWATFPNQDLPQLTKVYQVLT